MKDCVLDVIFFQNGKLVEYYYMYIQSMSLNIFLMQIYMYPLYDIKLFLVGIVS